MKKKRRAPKSTQPTRHKFTVLGQLIKLIPPGLVQSCALEHKLLARARTFTVLSHIASMMLLHLGRLMSLADICDTMRHWVAKLTPLGIAPATKNNLSNANKERTADFAQDLFWKTFEHLHKANPTFNGSRPNSKKRVLPRFKCKVHAVDSTVLELVANCMDWAKHRRKKAAAKMHLMLNVGSFLPTFAIVDTAKEHDNKRAREVCAGLQSGEIVLFDKAYVDFLHLRDLCLRGVLWVTRAKDNMQFKKVRTNRLTAFQKKDGIVKDQIIRLTGAKFKDFAGWTFRRVEAWVEVDGQQRLMVFITNGTAWSPRSVCDLYKARWEIEVFFKQVKQTLGLSTFVGYSANALRWQVWTALLVYVLLRFMAHLSNWGHSFARLFAVIRTALWDRVDLLAMLRSFGTARGSFKFLDKPQPWQPVLRGMEAFFMDEPKPEAPKRPRGRPKRPAREAGKSAGAATGAATA